MKNVASSIALALAGTALVTTPVAAAQVQIQTSNPVIELNVFEEVEVVPDVVSISAGVTTDAPTAVEALRQNSIAMQRVIDEIEAQGIDEDDIQTTGINLNARYDYDQREQRQIFRGYNASNRVTIKFREIDNAGRILDTLVAAGANDLNGPTFSKEDDSEAKAEARRNALERGRSMALEYARGAGYSNVRILQIAETVQGRKARPESNAIVVSGMRSADSDVPIRPGTIDTGVNVAITYEMTNGG